MSDFQQAREKEIAYHEQFYDQTALFEQGTWLARPVAAVMDHLELLKVQNLRVLDLGCGVGRNSIPMAQRIQDMNGTVVCVDLLESAITKLRQYAEQYGVASHIETHVADAQYFRITPGMYHYIVACSCLEHLTSEEAFVAKLEEMQEGTAPLGIHCIMINTNVKEIDVETGKEQEGLIELNLPTERAFSILHRLYADWEILCERQVHQEIPEVHDGRDIMFCGEWITFTARKGAR
jgi:cyclopropane fatty-acyl-phospholipid synthase-like methyltransferase